MNLIINIISIILLLALLIMAYRYAETYWSFKLDKPYQWEEVVKNKLVSDKLKKLERDYYDKIRFYNFWFQIERLKREHVEGDFAELGVYQGETAQLIHAMDTTRKLHLLDTFEGFNTEDLQYENKTDTKYSTVNFSDTNLESVKKYVDGNDNVFYYAGYFPETAAPLNDTTFSLVHLDADLYLPTIEGLKFFYKRLSPGGVIIIHDYNHNWDGIKKAIHEFARNIPESIIEIADWKGSAMIIKNKKITSDQSFQKK
jgi:O-methyltransferase